MKGFRPLELQICGRTASQAAPSVPPHPSMSLDLGPLPHTRHNSLMLSLPLLSVYSINVSLKSSHTPPPVLDPLMKAIIT